MKNSYKIGYIDNPFQVAPDFKPEYLQSGQSLPYIKTGRLIFLDNHIKIESRKISLKTFRLLILILPLILLTQFWTRHAKFNSFNLFTAVLLIFFWIIFLIIDITFLIKSYRKGEDTVINIKDIEFLKVHETIMGPFKIKWNVINFKVKDKDFWILPNGFKGNEREAQEILTNFKERGLSS
jgi:hypothetical protein